MLFQRLCSDQCGDKAFSRRFYKGVIMEEKRLKITFNAPAVLIIVGLSFIATVLNYITVGKSGEILFSTYHSAATSPMTWIRMFTHIFGHAGWSHLIGNMSYILLLGPMLEEKYSTTTLVIAVVITAFITGIVNYIFFPGAALCGASGVVFAFILLSSFTGFKNGEIPVTFILVAVFFLGQQIFEGLTLKDNVSNLSHVLGGIVGGVLGYILNRKK